LIFKHDNSNAIATELKRQCLDLARHHIRKRRCITKSESEEAEDELSLDINELRKKHKLAAIQSKIETLQVIETTKKSHQAFTQALMKNSNDLHIVFIVLMMTK